MPLKPQIASRYNRDMPPTLLKPPQTFTLGPYRLTLLDTGRFALDGGAMFGVVPKAIWNKLLPADDLNRVPLALNCLLLEYQNEKVLFETGIGNKFSNKYEKIYAIEKYETQYDAMTGKLPIEWALSQAGISPDAITKVLFSHLHFDHAGGGTKKQPDGSILPTFKNARYFVHKGEWEQAECPHERCKASYLKENYAPLRESGQLTLLDSNETEILPGLFLRKSGGHTPHHQVLILNLPQEKTFPKGFIFWADLLPTRHHVKIPFVMGYDEYPMDVMDQKRTLLKEAADNDWLHLFEHEIDHPVCRLTPTEKADDYTVSPWSFASPVL